MVKFRKYIPKYFLDCGIQFLNNVKVRNKFFLFVSASISYKVNLNGETNYEVNI